MEMKEFDNRLMTLSHEFRECRSMTQKVTKSYPEHVRIAGETLEKTMMHADLIVSQIQQVLHQSRHSLFKQYMSAEEKST